MLKFDSKFIFVFSFNFIFVLYIRYYIINIIAARQFSIENFGWLSDAPCASVRNGMREPESIRRIFFIFCMKLIYYDTTITHISNFQKIQHGRRYEDNYR